MTSKDISFFTYLKAGEEGINMVKAVEKQIQDIEQTMECSCGGVLKFFQDTIPFPYNVGSEQRKLRILNAPLHKCENCNEVVQEVFLYADVEKAIEEEIFLRLNQRQNIPDTMDFKEFTI